MYAKLHVFWMATKKTSAYLPISIGKRPMYKKLCYAENSGSYQ